MEIPISLFFLLRYVVYVCVLRIVFCLCFIVYFCCLCIMYLFYVYVYIHLYISSFDACLLASFMSLCCVPGLVESVDCAPRRWTEGLAPPISLVTYLSWQNAGSETCHRWLLFAELHALYILSQWLRRCGWMFVRRGLLRPRAAEGDDMMLRHQQETISICILI